VTDIEILASIAAVRWPPVPRYVPAVVGAITTAGRLRTGWRSLLGS